MAQHSWIAIVTELCFESNIEIFWAAKPINTLLLTMTFKTVEGSCKLLGLKKSWNFENLNNGFIVFCTMLSPRFSWLLCFLFRQRGLPFVSQWCAVIGSFRSSLLFERGGKVVLKGVRWYKRSFSFPRRVFLSSQSTHMEFNSTLQSKSIHQRLISIWGELSLAFSLFCFSSKGQNNTKQKFILWTPLTAM